MRFHLPSPEKKVLGGPSAWMTSSGEFHRVHKSASSPHSLHAMDNEGFLMSSVSPSLSEDDLVETKGENPEGGTDEAASTPEVKLLLEASQNAHDYLVHVICRAQTHWMRDFLWFRLLAGVSGGEQEKTEPKKRRKQSESKRSSADLTAGWLETKGKELLRVGKEMVRHCLTKANKHWPTFLTFTLEKRTFIVALFFFFFFFFFLSC